MSSKFTAWLRVIPAPASLAESSAIFKHLNNQGRVSTFLRRHRDDSSAGQPVPSSISSPARSLAWYYTVFPHEPPHLQRSFQVQVYHDAPDPRDEDPFNIRGLQDRKPLPAPVTFDCWLERAKQGAEEEEKIKQENPYHGSFKIRLNDWLTEVLEDLNAPPSVRKGLGIAVQESAKKKQRRMRMPKSPSVIRMDSLTDVWKEAVLKKKAEQEVVDGQKSPSNEP